ncbi:MAG: hypothetical protein R2939_07490 [Kofleriaceae bacterium]
MLALGCGGDDDGGGGIDAPVIDAPMIDAAGTVDADPTLPDADTTPDAMQTSNVTVTANCTGIMPADIDDTVSTSGLTFTNTAPSIPVGGILRFESNGSHNLISAAGTSASNVFQSGAVGVHVACLQFDAAATIDFRCGLHASMTGTLTVGP